MVYKICLILFCTLAAVTCQRTVSRLRPTEYGDNYYVNGDEIPGEAGIDYPVLESVPQTGFTCDDFDFPGYYADPLSGCQAYYRCHKSGRGVGTLCPNGTIFNQETLVCDWWYNFDCSLAVEFYDKNVEILEAMALVDANNALAPKDEDRLRALAQSPQRLPQGLRRNFSGRSQSLNAPLASRLLAAGRLPLTSNLGRLPITSNLGRLPITSNLRRLPITSDFGRNPQALRRPSFVGQTGSNNVRPSSDRYYDNDSKNNNNNNANQRNTKENDSNNNRSNGNSINNRNNEIRNEISDDVEFNGYDANGNDISRAYLPPSK